MFLWMVAASKFREVERPKDPPKGDITENGDFPTPALKDRKSPRPISTMSSDGTITGTLTGKRGTATISQRLSQHRQIQFHH